MVNIQTINFNNDEIVVVDNKVSVKKLCENIGLTGLSSQYEKIKKDESFESEIILYDINGVIQEVLFIPINKIDGWLFSINPNKVKPEVKQKLIEYKKECFNVLNNYFNNGIAVNHRASNIDLQKILDTLEKQNQEIQNLKNQLILKEQEKINPFRGFYDNFKPRKRENEFAYTRKDWMLLLSECERVLVEERKSKRQLLISRVGAL
jgi:hypothetical protein